jgi:hypothetical protein
MFAIEQPVRGIAMGATSVQQLRQRSKHSQLANAPVSWVNPPSTYNDELSEAAAGYQRQTESAGIAVQSFDLVLNLSTIDRQL